VSRFDAITPREVSSMVAQDHQGPIGVFDSGVGGLTVLGEIRRRLPGEDILYLADQAHVPYGPRSKAQVKGFSEGIVQFLLGRGAKLIVVACNTASAAALSFLRRNFPEVPFVGMEPAVKPAAERTVSGVVGVLATPATFQGELYHRTVERFARDVTVLQHTCPGLVEEIELGRIRSQGTRDILEGALEPMLNRGVDKIVLGCTHYPFVIPVIKEIVGPEVQVIDPAPAVARQVVRMLEERELCRERRRGGRVTYLTSGDPAELGQVLTNLTGAESRPAALSWMGGELVLE